MSCELYGEGDRWIKTCLTSDGSRLRVCDPCHQTRAPELIIVLGHWVVTGRCDSCGCYDNPGSSRRPSPASARTPTGGCAGRARRRDVDGGAPIATRLPAG
jgi:hypothetical protein